jgi:chitinase
MFRIRWSITISAILLCIVSDVPLGAQSQSRMFAPYVDMSKIADRLPQIQAESGIKTLTLAFVVSGNDCMPAWGGTAPISSDTSIAAGIKKVRTNGGDVIVAFGGYDGTDLAQSCADLASLQGAYQAVVDKYKAKVLDFDVEHIAIEDPVSVDRRSQALKALADANPGLQINYTLPATPAGLTELSMNVIKSAVKYGTPVAVVNLMTMDYGSPVIVGAMGPNAVAAASGATCQLKSLGLKVRVGITPMIGINDSEGETFTLDDAQIVVNYAMANSNSIALLAFWSVGRDNGGCSATVSPSCSGIAQPDWAFTRIFQRFQ